MRDSKRSWPKFSLLISALLWLLAWELVTSFLPIEPRAVIRAGNLETATDDFLAGFSPDGGALVTTVEGDPALSRGTIYHLWDTRTGQDLGTVGNEETYLFPNLVYTSQKNLLDEIIFPGKMGTYTLYDLTAGRETTSVELRRDAVAVTYLCFSSDGRTLACSTNTDDGGDLRLIDVTTSKIRVHLQGGNNYGSFGELVLSHDGRTLATQETKPIPDDYEGKLIILDTSMGTTRRILLDGGDFGTLSLSPDGTKLAAHCTMRDIDAEDGIDLQIRVWDLPTGEQIASLRSRGFPQFLPDGEGLAIRDDESVRFCDLTGREIAVTNMGGHCRRLFSIPETSLMAVAACHQFTPSPFLKWCGTFLGIKGLAEEKWNDQLAFIDTRTGQIVADIVRPRIGCVEVSPDGKTLALQYGQNNGSIIEIWDIPPRKPLRWVLALLAIPSVVMLITLWRCRRLAQISAVNRSPRIVEG